MKTRHGFPKLLDALGCRTGVEIGTYQGDFAAYLLTHWDGHLTVVDPWVRQDGWADMLNHDDPTWTVVEQRAREQEAARQKAEAEAKERERQRAEEEKRRQEEARRKAEEERRRQEEERRQREEAEKRKREEQARREAEEKRKAAERRLREQQLEALAEEADRQREAEARQQREAAAARAREAQMMSESQKYQALIRERLGQVWYPPSSATEKMIARLQITLLPTGELQSVKLVSSSGNTAFDNSALGAVKSLSRYPIPDDRATFERYFRQFTIEFNLRRLQ